MVKENQKDKDSLLEETFDPYKILKSPLATEKCIRAVEFENVLTFSVHTRATKKDVKKAVEDLFKVAVDRVNLQNSFTGNKKAHVKLKPSSLASDISADLGFI
jgi:ribosomal protein L23